MDSADRFLDLAAAGESRPTPVRLGDLARRLDLAPTEIRLLERLLAGEALDRAARLLGIDAARARDVRRGLLDKAGVPDLDALLRLAEAAER